MTGPKERLATVAGRVALTFALSLAGGSVAQLFGLPAAWLLGGTVAVATAAIAGLRIGFPPLVTELIFIGTGLTMGASVARDSLALIGLWPVTIAALAIEVVLIILVTGWLTRKLFGLDRGTAYLSAFPGQLNLVMTMAAAGVGNPRQIVIMQMMRLMMLTVAVPLGALVLPVGHYLVPQEIAEIPWTRLGLTYLLCAGAGFLFSRLRVPAPFALGAMAMATTLKLTGHFDGRLPPLLVIFLFSAMGGVIGSRFVGITRREMQAAAVSGVIGTFITMAVVTAVAFAASLIVAVPFGQIWLGLSPGALESMGALGIALGFDTAFIAAHHVMRILMLSFAIPAVALLVRAPSADRQNAG